MDTLQTTDVINYIDQLPFLSVLKTNDLTEKLIEIVKQSLLSQVFEHVDTSDLQLTEETANNNVDKYPHANENIVIYYVDCINEFPIARFQESIPLTKETQKKVYDRINVLKCFDLDDLYKTILKTIQFVKSTSFKEVQAEGEKGKITKILMIINGLDILWDTYSMHGLKHAKRKLGEILVRIRSFRNLESECLIKTILTFETGSNARERTLNKDVHTEQMKKDYDRSTDVFVTVPLGPNTHKKRNIFVLSNYILNFYADAKIK